MQKSVEYPSIERLGLPPDFFREYWQQGPGHFPRSDTLRFDVLSGIAATVELLTNRATRPPFIRVVKDQKPVNFVDYCRLGRHGSGVELIDPHRLMDLFVRGGSIVLQGLDENWAPLNALCRTIEDELNLEVHANAYITPPRAQAMPIHTDDHEVIALQVHGSKRWLVYATNGLDSMAGVTPSDVSLREGDILYVPRHAPHVAATSSGTSIHVALAILPEDDSPSGDRRPVVNDAGTRDIEEVVRLGLLAPGLDVAGASSYE